MRRPSFPKECPVFIDGPPGMRDYLVATEIKDGGGMQMYRVAWQNKDGLRVDGRPWSSLYSQEEVCRYLTPLTDAARKMLAIAVQR